MTETLQDKGKRLQKQRDYKIDVDKYILVHVDGRSFSKKIKNRFNKPFDDDFIKMMNETAIYLCENVQGAKIAYVQSDEISLLLKKDTPEGDIFFGGRLCKMQSIIAALATAKFNQLITAYELVSKENEGLAQNILYTQKALVEMITKLPLYQFDCKVWDVDTANDALAWFLFRNIDCIRNSKQQFVQTYLPHNAIMGHNSDEQVQMAIDMKGKDWNECPDYQKYGRIVSKEEFECALEDGTPYIRTRWVAHDGIDLTDVDKRNEFIENNQFFKE